MKFEKEATTKSGRRTWKVTYELVRGPEPKQKRKAQKAETPTAQQAASKSNPLKKPPTRSSPKKAAASNAKRQKGRAGKHQGQLGLF